MGRNRNSLDSQGQFPCLGPGPKSRNRAGAQEFLQVPALRDAGPEPDL